MIKHSHCPICQNEQLNKYLVIKDHFFSKEDFQLQKCPVCDLVLTNPFPDRSEIGRYYKSEEYYSHPDKSKTVFSWIYNAVKSYNIAYKYRISTSGLEKGSLLDIGCGSGDFLAFSKKNGWRIQGIEPDSEARKHSEKLLGISIFSPEYLSEQPETQYDVITMWHVLEHVQDLNWQVYHLKRLLKPGGRLIVAVPNINCYDASHYGVLWAGYDVPRHLFHFSFQTILKLMQHHGFKYLKREPLYFDAYYISLLSQRYKSKFLYPFNALLIGYISNLKARKTREFSSNVYIFYAD